MNSSLSLYAPLAVVILLVLALLVLSQITSAALVAILGIAYFVAWSALALAAPDDTEQPSSTRPRKVEE
jgi:hypothetical protein